MTSQWVHPEDGTKVCAKCEQRLPGTRFRANPRLSSGLDSWCKECHLEASRRSRARHRGAHPREAPGAARQQDRYAQQAGRLAAPEGIPELETQPSS